MSCDQNKMIEELQSAIIVNVRVYFPMKIAPLNLQDLQAITKEKSKTDEYNSTPPGQYESIRLVEWTTRLGDIKEQILSAENTVQKIRTAFEAINTASRGNSSATKDSSLKMREY
jgi:hypothetical protein